MFKVAIYAKKQSIYKFC